MKNLKTLVLRKVSAEFIIALGMISVFMVLGFYSREFALDFQANLLGV